MLIDTHSHLNFSAYKNDWEKVISCSLAENIWMINAGSKYETSKRAIEIAENYKEGVYAAVGLHPIHLGSEFFKTRTDPEEGNFAPAVEIFDAKKYKELILSSKKVVAIGEIGLDYYYRPKTKTKLELFKEKQKEVFIKQLELAKELNLPVILHCRMAHNDLLEILKKFFRQRRDPVLRDKFQGVIHCFTGTWQEAEKYLEMGFYLGINGIMYKFYPHTKLDQDGRVGTEGEKSSSGVGVNLKEVIEKTPIEKILIETDCPYLIPPLARQSPRGGGGRNEPVFVKYIAEEIAKIKNIGLEKVAEATTQNARRLFNL